MSAQDVTSREGLSRGAEALREKLDHCAYAFASEKHDPSRRIHIYEIACTIVQELGITEEVIRDLRHQMRRMRTERFMAAAKMLECSADNFSTLLELAGESDGE